MLPPFSSPTPAIVAKKELAPEPLPHTVEAELLGSRPRPAIYVGQTLFWRLMLRSILAVVAVVLFLLAERDIASWTALIERGVPIKAAVYDKSAAILRHDSQYFLLYRFAADGRTFRNQTQTDRVGYEDPNNDKILVTYLPHSGGIYQIGTATSRRRADRIWEWAIGGFVLIGVCGAAILLHEHISGQQIRLLRFGVATSATVMSGIVMHQKQTKTYWLDYKFVAGDTRTYTGQSAVSRKMYDAQVWGQSTYTVLYDEASPTNNALYTQLTAAQVLGK